MTGLYHSAKGTTWNNHKYTDKITKNGKTRYVYDQKTDYSGQLKSKLEELGLPKAVVDQVDEYASSIDDFYKYIEEEDIQSVDQLKDVLKKAIKNSGAKHIEPSDVDRLFNVAEKVAKGDKLTKNDYFDIAEVGAKANAKDLSKIGDSIKYESSAKQTRAAIDQAIAANKGKPVKVIYLHEKKYLPTDKATFGKKVYWKLKDGAEKVSDFTTDMKVKGIQFVRKLFG